MPTGEKLKQDIHFKGPLSKRSCTDLSCLFVFIAFFAYWGHIAHYGMFRQLISIQIGFSQCTEVSEKSNLLLTCSCLKIAFTYGDLNRVVFPVDSMGRICGIDSRVSDKPHAQFSDLAKCFDIGMPLFGCKTICVEKCPDTSFSFDKNRCRSNFNEIRDHLICHGDINKDEIRNCRDIEESINDRSCARWYLPSYSRKSFD